MAFVLLAFDDVGLGFQLEDRLRTAGYTVRWEKSCASGPTTAVAATPPDVVVLAADGLGERLASVAAAWRALDPTPGVVAIGGASSAVGAAAARLVFVASAASSDVAALRAAIDEAARLRFTAGMSPALIRRALGLAADASPQLVLLGARAADLASMRAALGRHAADYVWTDDAAIAALREDRALIVPEIETLAHLDGTLTLQQAVRRGPLDALAAGRFVWALASLGAAELTAEPRDLATPRRRALAAAREHLRARHERLKVSTFFDVLEVTPDVGDADIERAYAQLALRYAPGALAGHDLATLAPLAAPVWQEIERARAALLDLPTRGRYNDYVALHRKELRSEWLVEPAAAAEAREAYARGQRALIDGDVYKAVSDIATAARYHPGHPDYEASLCWARYRAQVSSGKDRAVTARAERATAEAAMRGHRPWPRGLLALGLLCAADGDAAAARWHLQEALAVDPSLPAAQQMLQRLGR